MARERIDFRKMISEPTLLKAMRQLAHDKNITLTKAAYELMALGASGYISNKKTVSTFMLTVSATEFTWKEIKDL